MTQDIFEFRRGNPLKEGIPELMTFVEMGVALSYDPSKELPRPPQSWAERKLEAMRIKNRFVPTRYCCELANRLHLAISLSLDAHDPRLAHQRKKSYDYGLMAGRDLAEIPWEASGAQGFVLQGPTGESKSLFLERFLSLFPQVLERPADLESGWLALTQVVWLKAPMPTLRGIKGFILELATAIDDVAGTSYAKQLNTRQSTDKQLVMLLIWMRLHKVPLLVLEEAQEDSMGGAVIAKELLLFFLKALNWGIAVLIVGNPKAMAVLRRFVQDHRRFSDGGWHTVLPVVRWDCDEWCNDLVPGIWSYNVLAEPDQPIKDLERFLYLATGGQRYLLARLRREALLLAIEEGASRVMFAHVKRARHSSSIKPLWSLVDALVERDSAALAELLDYPVELLEAAWKLDEELHGKRT